MTLILEFQHKLIFYKPGILRYAMRQAGPRFCMSENVAERRQLLSLSLKRGWAEARAELAALQRLQSVGRLRRTVSQSHEYRGRFVTGGLPAHPRLSPAALRVRHASHFAPSADCDPTVTVRRDIP
jgi:hypothetical protein